MKDGETDEKEDGKMKEEKVKGKAKRVTWFGFYPTQ
jgi:hypothetical protein